MNNAINLLLVDDNARNLDVLESILAAPNLGLVRASNADEALLALISQEFAAIILDVQMPDTSGLELARIIKARKTTQHVPIIFLTAHFQEDQDILLGYSVGAVDYLTKPINSAILKSKVEVFVDLFRKTCALAEVNAALEAEIRQRSEIEEQLRGAQEELERRVTERTARLAASLHEKEVLLREIHHRVKNNMQIISSLLSLQSRILPETQADLLRETQSRIHSMAQVHEKLYRSEDLARVNMADYLQSLLQPIFHAYRRTAAHVRLNRNIAPLLLTIDSALPCGLLLNELVSNVFKHAFPECKDAEITVQFLEDRATGRIRLLVADNGVGLPQDFEERGSKTLGLRLVHMLTAQLHGRLEIRQDNGSGFLIDFPAAEHKSLPSPF